MRSKTVKDHCKAIGASGGKARAKSLSATRRKEIAAMGGRAKAKKK